MKRSLRDGNTWTAKVVNDRSLQDSISRFAEVLNPFGLQFSVSVRFIRQPKGLRN